MLCGCGSYRSLLHRTKDASLAALVKASVPLDGSLAGGHA
jgi:hypothetical protein